MLDNAQINIDSLVTILNSMESAQKERHNSATEIEDAVEATIIANDAWAKIKHIKNWVKSLQQIKDEIANIFPDSEIKLSDADNTKPPVIVDPSNHNFKWGEDTESSSKSPSEYVHDKLSTLSKSGYVFTSEQLQNMQNPLWSHNKLNLPVQFMHIYDIKKNSSEKALIKNMSKNYLVKHRLKFGNFFLIFYSNWTVSSVTSFDVWYDSLEITKPQSKPTTIDIKLDVSKAVTKGTEANITTDFSYQPTEIVLLDKAYPVCNWQEVFLNLCEIMVLKQPYKMAGLGADSETNSPKISLLSYNKQSITHTSKQLSNGLFADISGSENEIRLHCNEVLQACGYNNDVLKIN